MKNSGAYKILKPVVIASVCFAVILTVGCTNRGQVIEETPTSGNIKIIADESFEPIVNAEIDIFTGLYKRARITPAFLPETDLISAFLKDSVKLVVSSWEPTEEQKQLLFQTQIVVRTTAVAYDAIALVLNKENKDSLFTYQNVNDIFTGKIADWKDINPESKLGKISIVFDNNKSANIRYFRELFDLDDQLAENFYAVNSNAEVVDYVTQNKSAIGLVSVNWICDDRDSTSRVFSDKIKTAAISHKYLSPGIYSMPDQGSIYDKSYPFTRTINLVSRETFRGLASGFTTFFASEQGQRIVLKSGLVPATMPIRLIQFKK
ncbi:MAG: substrate-binding domain-containing protein [Bacteroidales bacterium]|nr:substrate-binding domain-containing protein [Bacteroidales bacterium]